MTSASPIDRIAPTHRPQDRRPAGYQTWSNLLFLHWPVPTSALRPLIPEGLTLDPYQGQCWVGLVPFQMAGVRPAWAPAVPGISWFLETNLRTYVLDAENRPGVWFFSLEASRSVAVLAARAGWHLPYFKADMTCEVNGSDISYTSQRKWPKPTPAELQVRFTVGPEIGPSTPQTLEHFLLERYLLFSQNRQGRLYWGQVHHRPYIAHEARVHDLSESILAAGNIQKPQQAPHALFSPGVDVEIFGLRPL